MPFDIQLSIAALDFKGGDRPDLDNLRARYPELDFVFDLLDDKWLEADGAAIEHRDEMREREREHEEHIDELETRVQDMRLAFEQIKELTVDVEITNIIEDVL
jgi:hypothetical protein